ncbi:translation initiation factor IF-2 domain-containing protein [Cylindrospermum sp. NIES-4074]|nr:translation initiation factor IF-2 domain-containing protein [Cylindrospermum sp. NIES-4074]
MSNTNIRISELSKELNLDSKELIAICDRLKIAVKSQNSTISETDAKRIHIAAKKLKSTNIKTNAEDWGYIFINSTIDRFISNLEGENALKLYPEFRERRERANELMFECVGQKPCLFYVRRQGAGKDSGEEIWDLTIATDSDDFKLPARLKQLGKTLGFRASVQKNGNGGLKILSVFLLHLSRGIADGYAVPFRLRLLPTYQNRIDIPPAALKRISTMPVCGNHIPTEEQLQAWKGFLQIEEKIAKARQFCVSYIGYKYDHKRRISFEINIASATLDGAQENPLSTFNFWERVKKARNDELKLFDTPPTGKNWQHSRKIGSIEEVDPKHCIISIRLERELADYIATERYQFPNTGYLFFEAVGEIQQIQRKKKALEDLNNGRTQNPYLGNFLFDASQARRIKKNIELRPEDLLLSSANPGQKAAVETVLAAEDLVLIQGPPGTGKTTVIAEICYQVALRGGRTLITSQANLAVDNALSRLVHNPVIRAVRKGRAEKVGEEGQPFLEDQVIGTWLENTANDCENNISQRLENIQIIRELLASLPRFTDYFKAEKEFSKQQNELKDEQVNIETNLKNQEAIYSEFLTKKTAVKSLITGLETLLDTRTNINWDSPEITNFLPLLQPYTEGNSLVQNFITNVRAAINHTDKLGLVRPQRGAFGLAVWLRDTVATEIVEFKSALNYAQNAAELMLELAELVQVVRQKSTYLNQLQTDYQPTVNHQQNLQQTVKSWENRKREIDYIISAVTEWKSTARLTLYEALKTCQQSGLQLTDNLVQLPLGLLMFANTLKLPILPKNYKVQLPEWDLLTKAIAYEIDGGFIDRRGKQHNFSYFLQQNFSEIPLVLSKSDRTQWQKISQELNNYQLLTPKQRKLLVENTQLFLIRMQQMYGKSWELNNIDATLNQIIPELLESILVNARKCVSIVKNEAEQQLQLLQQQLNALPKNSVTNEQITTAQNQVDIASQNANLKLSQVINILQELNQLQNVPTQLRTLAEKYLTSQANIWEQPQEFSTLVKSWESHISQLETLISSLEHLAVLEIIKNSLHEHFSKLEAESVVSQQEIEKFQIQLNELSQRLQPELSSELVVERNWWETLWQTIPNKFKPEINDADLFELEFLRSIRKRFKTWQQQLEKQENYINKYQNFVQDWIAKLRNPSEGDSQDLRQIYLDNANVVGITCVQAASRDFSEEFKYFDVVIIDEVSKCTPPELLIPALKGKKLVMVGDHRQLPPMLDTSTLEEVAKEIGSTREELQFLEESLFKSQFETADDSIKQMLTTQYRMHPFIMGAINQFYDGKLECGLLEPDIKRAHNLAGEIIQKNHHITWVKMPQEKDFFEEPHGTSFFNMPEIDVIERLCQQFEKIWAVKVANGEAKKEIAVITFYGAQLRKIDERLQSELYPSLQIRTGTVDRFQGMERPIVIVSMVRNNSKGEVGFAKKPERVNVAFSRAQELLVIVGCHDLFTCKSGPIGSMYSNVSNIVSHHGGLIDISRIYG